MAMPSLAPAPDAPAASTDAMPGANKGKGKNKGRGRGGKGASKGKEKGNEEPPPIEEPRIKTALQEAKQDSRLQLVETTAFRVHACYCLMNLQLRP